ncbi:MAG: DNA polymerase III subunit beta [Myxococcales bacterium]|nr:DNA polymerase III subunit beta [Myxococcales bacterium]MCB9642400.1 DNA polymerase III subunit beta [Myxococcales bacterium]
MRLLIGCKPLLKVVQIAQSVVPKKTSRPILTHLRLKATAERGLEVTATDEELTFQAITEAQVEIPGEITVAARDIYEIVRNMPDEPLRLEVLEDKGQLELSTGDHRIEFQLHTLAASDFPDVEGISPEHTYAYKVEDLLQLVDRTVFAVSQDEARYYLGGVFLECHEGENIRAVATDGHRLALAEGSPPEKFVLSPGKILPRKMLGELRKMLDTRQGEVRFGFQDKKVTFQHGPQTLTSLLVEGSFPDYRQVIPRSPSIVCRVARVELLEALRRISLLSPDKTGGVRVQITEDALQISSQHTGRGQAKEEVRLREGGGDIEIGFNASYFIDALNVIDTADVLLEFTNYLSPCLLKPYFDEASEQEKGKSHPHLNVIMPMRL